MASADQYRQQFLQLKWDDLKIEGSSFTLELLKERKSMLRLRQSELRQIKRCIDMDIKAIRAEFSIAASRESANSHTWTTILAGRGAAGKLRADQKRRLSIKRDQLIAPYESLKLTIDQLLTDLESVRMGLETTEAAVKAGKL